MAVLAGKGGSVKIGSDVVAEVQQWQLNLSGQELETTALGDNWREFTQGLKDWTATLEANLDLSDTNGQKALYNALINGSEVALKLFTDSASNWSGNALVTAFNPVDAVDETVKVSITCRGTGQLQLA